MRLNRKVKQDKVWRMKGVTFKADVRKKMRGRDSNTLNEIGTDNKLN